jgi:hypothetical protein
MESGISGRGAIAGLSANGRDRLENRAKKSATNQLCLPRDQKMGQTHSNR